MGTKIAVAGDVMLGRLVNDYMRQVTPGHFWGDVLPLIASADFSLINLECALTKSTTPWRRTPKVFHFRADPAPAIAVLKAARIGMVNLANNHVLDFEVEGLRETLQTLRDAGIRFCGAGMSIAEAAAPAVVEVAGMRIGVIGATDNTPEWQAAADTPGVNYVEISPDGAARLAEAVRAARTAADLLILSLHWGPNMRQRPTDAFVQFAREMIDAGADIIHGHSAHVFQGLEIYRRKAIMFDTGDFIDDYAVEPFLRNDQGFLFELAIAADGSVSNVVMHPTLIDNFQANLARGTDRDEILERMTALCAERGTRVERHGNRLVAFARREPVPQETGT